MTAADLVAEFQRRAEAVGAQVRRFGDFEQAVTALAEWSASSGETAVAVSSGELPRLLVQRAGLSPNRLVDAMSPRALSTAALGITGVRAAVAETGTIVLDAALERARMVSLLPEVHLAIVIEAQVIADLTELFVSLDGKPPAALTMITGPSRTADIELTLAIGVHGPKECWIWIVADEAIATPSPESDDQAKIGRTSSP